jgi:hypothetical protein
MILAEGNWSPREKKTPVPLSLCPPKSHVDRSGIETGVPHWDTDVLSHGAALICCFNSHTKQRHIRARAVYPPLSSPTKYVWKSCSYWFVGEVQHQVTPLLPVARACRCISVARWRDCVLHTAVCTGHTASGHMRERPVEQMAYPRSGAVTAVLMRVTQSSGTWRRVGLLQSFAETYWFVY